MRQLRALEQEYLRATEWQLATLEQLCERKRTSQSDKDRQREIVIKMLRVCQELDPLALDWNGPGIPWGRVDVSLDQARSEPSGLPGVIDRFISECSY